MKDTLYLAGFLVGAAILLFVGRDQLPSSTLLNWGLTFGATTAAAILLVSLYRVQLELNQSRRELARRAAELSFAREVQAALFPRELPTDKGFEISAICIPAQGISGDYYDVVNRPDGTVAVAVADVSGKGVSAAILMSNLQARFRALLEIAEDPGEIGSRLNTQLYEITETNRYITALFSIWDPASGRLSYVNAGHLPPIMVSDSRVLQLDRGGPPLGMFPGIRYECGQVDLFEGDLMVLYSDGITEAESEGEEEYGLKRLEGMVRSNRGLSPAELQSKVIGDLEQWMTGEAADDITLVIMRVVGRRTQ